MRSAGRSTRRSRRSWMRTMSERRDDLPEMVAAITVTIPRLVLSAGFAYLRLKRKARKSSKLFEKGLVDSGISPDMAHQLAMKFETDLSIRRMVSSFGGDFTRWGKGLAGKVPPQPDQ